MAASVEDRPALGAHRVGEARRVSTTVAQRAVSPRPEAFGARLGGQDPRPLLERRLVPHVLLMAAIELGDPCARAVLMEPDDDPLHAPVILTVRAQ